MDPFTAGLNAFTAAMQVFGKLWDGATPDQKQTLIQFWIDDQKWWRTLFANLTPRA